MYKGNLHTYECERCGEPQIRALTALPVSITAIYVLMVAALLPLTVPYALDTVAAIAGLGGIISLRLGAATPRDLKPGNVMLTKLGAKLMDFGLAKASPAGMAPASSLAMTLSGPSTDQPLTARGTVVGTFQYMSPEQVEGKEADARSDIFAVGVLLYEMATGRHAFTGKTQ